MPSTPNLENVQKAQLHLLRCIGQPVFSLLLFTVTAGAAPLEKFSAIQFRPTEVPSDNIASLVALVRQAAAAGAGVVVLPEDAINCLSGSGTQNSELWEMSSTQAVRRFRALAKDLRIWIALSLPQRNPKTGAVAQTALLFNNRGLAVIRQSRLERDSEKALLTASRGYSRIGVSTGENIAQAVPRLAELGARTVFISAAWNSEDTSKNLALAKTLASQHDLNLVIANRPLQDSAAIGALVSRRGEIVSRADVAGNQVVIGEMDEFRGADAPNGLPSDPTPSRASTSESAVRVGRTLFFDGTLASDGRTSCASCHDPAKAFTDGKPVATGVFGRSGEWNTPSLLNASYYSYTGWTGKNETLQKAVVHAFGNPAEMETRPDDLVTNLRRSARYGAEFKAAYSDGDISFNRVAECLAAYVRTLTSAGSPFDQLYYEGDQRPGVIAESAKRGVFVFMRKGRCVNCHRFSGEDGLFTDNRAHTTGIVSGTGAASKQVVTPILRNVALTAPYMHNGSLRTLSDVIDFYDRGGHPNSPAPQQPLRLTAQERADLIEFLKSLTGTFDKHRPGSQTSAEGWKR